MSNIKKPIPVLHSEITEWKSDVELIRSEIETFQKQLNEIASKNSSQEVLSEVEHFQNQFIRQLEVTDELLHNLHAADHELAEKADVGSDSNLIFMDDNKGIRDSIATNNKLFSELKNEYHLFLEKWM